MAAGTGTAAHASRVAPKRLDYRTYARRIAARYGLNPKVFERQIDAESGFNPHSGSGAGAVGIAQFLPSTAKGLGINPYDPYNALAGAAKLMAGYVKKYGSYDKALRAYNAGEGAIERSRGFGETNAYVQKILGGHDPGGLSKPHPKGVKHLASSPGAPQSVTVPAGSTGVADLLSQLQDATRPQLPQQTPLAAPAFSATKNLAMPTQYQSLPDNPAPVNQDAQKGLSDLIAQAQTLEQPVTVPAPAGSGGGGSGGGGAAPGRRPVTHLTVAPNADRAGVPTSHYLKRILSEAGVPGGLVLTTGSNHKQYARPGAVSDHWYGKGADLGSVANHFPLDGKRGDEIAAKVMIRLGVPRSKAIALARQGGIHEIQYQGHRWQVIWKAADHHDHVHVGVR